MIIAIIVIVLVIMGLFAHDLVVGVVHVPLVRTRWQV